MDNQWEENLRQRFADRKMAAPDGLWNSIEAAMTERGATTTDTKHKKTKARVVPMWVRKVAASAACLAVIAGVTAYLHGERDEAGRLSATVEPVRKTDLIERGVSPANAGGNVVVRTFDGLKAVVAEAASKNRAYLPAVSSDGGRDRPVLTARSTVSITDDTVCDTTTKVASGNDAPVVIKRLPTPPTRKKAVRLPDTRPARASKDVTVGVYGMGLTSVGNAGAASSAELLVKSAQSSPYLTNDFVLLSSALKGNGPATFQAEEVKVKHRQPLKVGVSARFRLTDRVGVESGVFYSYLSSDFEQGDNKGGCKTSQKLHYAGVPLKVTYSFLKTDYLDVYAGVGGTVEFCLTGNSHTDYISSSKVVRTDDSDIRDKRPQFSAGVSAGVQYNFNNIVGVYAEPGVSYYINNGSDVSNFYKDKPWNFNLSVGLRFTFD